MAWQFREIMDWARKRKIFASSLMMLTLGVGILLGTVISGRVQANKDSLRNGATPLAIPDPVQMSTTFAAIVNKVEPAVVNISTTQVLEQKKQRRPRSPQVDPDDPFSDFMDRFFDGRPEGPAAERSLKCS